jgi:hypothetical protein
MCTQRVWLRVRNEFRDVGGLYGEISSQPSKILQDRVDRLSELDSFALITPVLRHILNYTEQTFSTRDGKHHRMMFAQQLLPIVNHSAALGWGYRVKDFEEADHSMSRQLGGHSDSVDNPSQDNFLSGPSCVYLQHLLD